MYLRSFAAVLAALVLLALPAGAAPVIGVSGVWSRPATATGVVYVTIHNAGTTSDALIAASSPVAKAVELHETVPKGTGSMSSGSMSGAGSTVMMMRPVKSITIPPNGTVMLKPGGYHIMLIGLHHDLKAGQAIPLELQFRKAGIIHTVSHVRAM